MKYKLQVVILFLVSIFSLTVNAQEAILDWGKHIGGTSWDSVKKIVVDNAGNTYGIGNHWSTLEFDIDSGSQMDTISCNGWYDMFIYKVDVNGELIWLKSIGDLGAESGWSIALDNSGNIYITGDYNSTTDFDPDSTEYVLENNGSENTFILKLDNNGSFVWVKKFRPIISSSKSRGRSITVDNQGNIIVLGLFKGIVDFNPGNGTSNLKSFFTWDIYVLKLNSNGNFVWVKQVREGGSEQAITVDVDDTGNIYTCGMFRDTIEFNLGLDTLHLISKGEADVLVQKFNPQGNLLWANQIGGEGDEYAYSLTVDDSSNVYITGSFKDTVDFNPSEGVFNLVSMGDKNSYIQKLNSNGELIWVKQLEGEHVNESLGVDLDSQGNVYVFGGFSGKVDFNPGIATNYLITNGTNYSKNGFILKLDNTGEFVWVKQLICSQESVNSSIAVDPFNNIYTVGFFRGTIDLDPSTDNLMISSIGENDVFINKFIQCDLTNLEPNLDSLPDIDASCSLTPSITPTANNGCKTYFGVPSISFPITDTTITEIVWTYYGYQGDIITQTQNVNWSLIDSTTTLINQTISSNSVNSTYQWLDCNNDYLPIAGETNQMFTIIEDGSYAVEITKNGCVDTSSCVLIDDYKNTFNVVASPNPTNGILHIDFDRLLEYVEVYISDLILGRSVFSVHEKNTNHISLDLSELSGVYCITLNTDKGQKTIKIIKQ